MGKVVIVAAAVGLGNAVGYAIQNWGNVQGWGWGASLGTGLTIAAVYYPLISRFR